MAATRSSTRRISPRRASASRRAGVAVAVAVAALAAALYLIADPASADLAAQRFRADLFEREGLTLFSTAWYGGHHTLAYSVLFPPLGALLTPQVVAALAAVAATWAVAALAGERGLLAGLVFVPAVVAGAVSGRLAFTLGVALAAAAVLAAARGRPALAALAAVATALASPVAAMFAALAGVALAAARPRGERAAGLALAAGAALPTAALVLAFPEGGTFPFAPSAFWPALGATLLVAALAPREWPAVRIGAALYAVLLVAAFALDTPVGGNASRLGPLVAAPLAALALWPRRPVLLAVVALPLAYWALQPAVRDWLRARDDPSATAAFHAPVAGFLEGRQPARVEVPFTQNHGETYHLARRLPIARGWERQVDMDRNGVFYEGRLTAARYERWLRENAIGYVAVPLAVPMDGSGEEEKRLALSTPRFLREVFRDADWRVFAVRGGRPLADGASRVTAIGAEGFTLHAPRPGTTTVRVRFTPYWAVLAGEGCIGPAPGGWTRVRTARAGRVEVGTRFALARVRARSSRCT